MTNIAILGYGNLGRGVEKAIKKNEDMNLIAIFTRRKPETLKINSNATVVSVNEIMNWKDKIDVLIICGGSATDLPIQTPKYSEYFNVVDSFDTHAKIPEHFENVDKIAKKSNKTAIISVGWDPGLFSINRLYAEAILPEGKTYTFWGKGVSQGHSDAIRRIDGVIDAKQYTIPIENALKSVRNGENPNLSTSEKHRRECFVVVEEKADRTKIENEIKNMPNYFKDYDTEVHFISKEELDKNHSKISHGGLVIRCGETSENTKNIIEYNLKLDSNPEFTSSVLISYARAINKLNKEGRFGCMTVFDIPPSYLSPKSNLELRKQLL